MSKQWGHGFHKGRENGETWGKLIESGKWEEAMGDIGNKLTLISMALKQAADDRTPKTDAWWGMLASAASKSVDEIAAGLPGTLTAIEKHQPEEA